MLSLLGELQSPAHLFHSPQVSTNVVPATLTYNLFGVAAGASLYQLTLTRDQMWAKLSFCLCIILVQITRFIIYYCHIDNSMCTNSSSSLWLFGFELFRFQHWLSCEFWLNFSTTVGLNSNRVTFHSLWWSISWVGWVLELSCSQRSSPLQAAQEGVTEDFRTRWPLCGVGICHFVNKIDQIFRSVLYSVQ